ncbi:XdhC family protein [Nesterenkonia flava]|uniref:XdhC family protein n=1 Tax=Nesterenkonia flava TaxID=469799 RepID=A0ABU1FV12_9MICC|nr:XdhC family protein [Nesterenkonia flava]MDR5712504.1 XdhC family protein [Nesterenkonia flava]
MLDRLAAYARCLDDPERWAVATIVGISGSSPSPVGTSMAVSEDLEIIGSLSGGCVEAAVAARCQQALEDGASFLDVFGPDGKRLGEIALTCGGRIEVLIQPLPVLAEGIEGGLPRLRQLARTAADRRRPELRWRRTAHTLGEQDMPDGAWLQEIPQPQRLVIEESLPPVPRLILSGVHDVSVHLAQLALGAGWRVDMVDIRPAFATPARVPEGVELSVGHPETVVTELLNEPAASWTAAVVMTHHPDLDVPVLHAGLSTPSDRLHLLGAMGSRRAQARRDAALAELGHTAEDRARIVSPLGLDLAAATPAETAVSMFAELIATKNAPTRTGEPEATAPGAGEPGTPLRLLTGPISRRPRTQSLTAVRRMPQHGAHQKKVSLR